MTPFDILFFGLLIAVVLIMGAELWILKRNPPPDDDSEPWIQVRPPDDSN